MARLGRIPLAVPLIAFLLALCAPRFALAAVLDEHGGPVKAVAVSRDGARALTASFDYSLIFWDLSRAAPLRHLYGHEAPVNDVAFLPDQKRAISASDDGTLLIWDLARGEPLARLQGHEGKVVAVAVSPDGRLAASAGWDRTVRLWDLERGREVRTLACRDNPNDIAFSPDGARLVAGTGDGQLQVWRTTDGVQAMAVRRHDFAITGLAVAPDGRSAASASVDETVQLWDLERGDVIATLYGHEGPVLSVALSPDGTLVASGGVDGTVRVWRRGDGDRLHVYARHQGPVWSVAFMPERSGLLSGGADGLVLTYDLAAPADDVALDSGPHAAAAQQVARAPAAPGETDRGAELFRKCVACHTVTPEGGHKAGPSLYRLFGRSAGSWPGYPYSRALRESRLVWTEETVDRLFAVGPEVLTPGSKMPLQRMPDPEDRARLIAWLKQVTAPEPRD